MESKEVYKALSKKYESDNKYYLENTYIYDWESDVFFRTSSHLHVEIEVKISKADFKKDFTKVKKHDILKKRFNGETWLVERRGGQYVVEYDELVSKVGEDGRRVLDENYKVVQVPSGRRLQTKINTTNIDGFIKGKFNAVVTQISSEINIKTLPNTPNKFYYACPEGLIEKTEVPEYAGLIYIKEGQCKIVKKAPQIHKDKLNLDRILLDKFYWKSVNLKNELKLKENEK